MRTILIALFGHVLCSVALLPMPALTSQAPLDPGAAWSQSHGLTRIGETFHAAGPRYAARITGEAIQLQCVLGAAAPACSLTLSIAAVQRGDDAVELTEGSGQLRQNGLVACIVRGAGVEERFETRSDGIEHSFVFAQPLPGRGDLVVRLRANTDLEPEPVGDGLRFVRPGIGGITIGGVTGIDANGRRAVGQLTWSAGCVEYRLPAGFVDTAQYPLVLDPILGTEVTVLPLGADVIADPDVAFDASSGTYLVVWARGVNAGQTQIQGQRVSAAGALVGGLITIHGAAAGETSADPAVANVNSVDRFVVVYERTPSGAATEIRARVVVASSGAVSSSVLVSPAGSGAVNPDIGGRGVAGGNSALAVWESSTRVIQAQLLAVPTTTALLLPPTLAGTAITVGSTRDTANVNPTLPRHGGTGGHYLVAWERSGTLVPSPTQIVGRVVSSSGGAAAVASGTTTLASSSANLYDPDCATIDGLRFLVVYEHSGLDGIACRPVTFASAPGSVSVGAEQIIDAVTSSPPILIRSVADPAVDYADLRYLIAYRYLSSTSSGTGFQRSTTIRLQEIGPDACILDPAWESAGTGSETSSTSTGLTGTAVATPAVAAVYSGNPNSQDDRGLVTWVRSQASSSGFPPVTTTQRGIGARRAEAVGQGGAVTTLSPSCGGAGTAAVNGPAVVGNPRFAFTLSGMPAGTSAVFFNLNGVQPLIPCGPCQVLPFGNVVFLLATNGAAVLPVPLPCAPALVNGTSGAQWTVIGPTACHQPQMIWSNVLSITIGS